MTKTEMRSTKEIEERLKCLEDAKETVSLKDIDKLDAGIRTLRWVLNLW